VTGRPITGATKVAGVIGDPVGHSLSPALHNAAYAALDLDWVYVAFPVPRGRGAAAVDAMRTLGLAGLNVTMPHKADAAAACDQLTPAAAALGSANTLVPLRDGRILGDSTDGEGFLGALRVDGVDPAGTAVVVIGAGGAARAIVAALASVAATVTVLARRPDAALAVAQLAPRAVGCELGSAQGSAAVARAAIVVNATSIGMRNEAPLIDVATLASSAFVAETIYSPRETPLLAAARARNLAGSNGLGMLVEQAALTFEILTGRGAPRQIMRQIVTQSENSW
jgi:shikimate dehydrogenase